MSTFMSCIENIDIFVIYKNIILLYNIFKFLINPILKKKNCNSICFERSLERLVIHKQAHSNPTPQNLEKKRPGYHFFS